ncbi:MAG: DUF2087 domain-containing protein [archaeon]
MPKKKDYTTWSKTELIREVNKLEKRKKYGLVWENKLEKVAELCKEKLPILKEDTKKAINKDKKYKEIEVNEIIKKYFSDFATIRRELVNYGYFHKDSYKSEYWVVKRDLTMEDIENNTILKKHAEDYLK